MKDRDAELDEIENDLKTPFIERPPHLDNGPGALCWLDGARRCGADCVAFNPEEGLDERGQEVDSPSKCRVLGHMEKHAEAAFLVASIAKKNARRDEDRERTEGIPTPPVGGRKTR